VIGIETIALHLVLIRRHPWTAWAVTASSLMVLAWLVMDYRAMGRGEILLHDNELRVAVGLRVAVVVPLSAISAAIAPTWSTLPSARDGYLNAMKPAQPNVLVVFREPRAVELLGFANRRVSALGLHLDAPREFLDAISRKEST
jgi:hypothetical protein